MQKAEMMLLSSFQDNMRVIIVGASGGIGAALTKSLARAPQISQIYALSRSGNTQDNPHLISDKITHLTCDFTKPDSLARAEQTLKPTGKFDLIIIATGLLQGAGLTPEKNLRALSHDNFAQSFMANTIGPAMCAQAFLPLLRRDAKAVFTVLSARVGSISDNRLGGWYAYRASKAALNMVIKTLSIEYGRRFTDTIIAGLHPGTVDTALSKPFQNNVPDGKLFTPDFSAGKLLEVIDGFTPKDSGGLFAWDGQKIPF
jgi:NAD(P)-dependent dehydrogenase (short-subunit alcohol dehydrogenase family)